MARRILHLKIGSSGATVALAASLPPLYHVPEVVAIPIKNARRYVLVFNKNTETDQKVIKKLDSVTSKCDYIRKLVLQDIEKNK